MSDIEDISSSGAGSALFAKDLILMKGEEGNFTPLLVDLLRTTRRRSKGSAAVKVWIGYPTFR